MNYTIFTTVIGADIDYNALDPADVAVTNLDDDTAGITVNPTSDLETTEAGGTDTFTIKLDSEPLDTVTINLTSSDSGEGTVAPLSVSFDATNWDTPQTITVTGVDDDVDNEDVAYTILIDAATSGDAKYAGIDPADVSVTNLDDDTAGITVSPTSGLVTTEAGGIDTFTVKLNSEPLDTVTIGLSSSDSGEGTVAPVSISFDATNWDTPQTITVTGVNDDVDDDDISYTIQIDAATSGDTKYAGIDPADASVTNLDDDTAGITVSPTSGLVTTEAGGTDTFTIKLNSEPLDTVTIGLSSSDSGEGTVAPVSISFDATNWDTPQTITVTGVNDDVDDDDISYTILIDAATSGDAKYAGIDSADVSVTNLDDGDSAGITISPTSGLLTREGGDADVFVMVLTSEPTDTVTIYLFSSDTTEGTVDSPSITFDASNWDTPQTVTVTGVNDYINDGDVGYTILTTAAVSGDSKYFGIDPADVAVINEDDDTAGVTLSPTSGLWVPEGGRNDTFVVILDSEPTADVTVTLTPDSQVELSVDGGITFSDSALLTFSSTNWMTLQNIVVRAVDDSQLEGNHDGVVTFSTASTDPHYNGVAIDDLVVEVVDNDTVNVESIVVNDGSAGRSMVTDLAITFNTEVSIVASAFQLINRGTGENVLTDYTTQVIGGKTVVTLTFLEGPSVVARPTGNTLDDGNYELTIDASKVTAFGMLLDGDEDGTAGGDCVFGAEEIDNFFRLFGDTDGSRFVGNNDYAAFRQAFRKSPGQEGYDDAFDSDGSSFIGNNDYALFRAKFRTGLPFE